MRIFWIAAVFASLASSQQAPIQIGGVDYFGYQGIDLDAVRRELPFRESELPTTMDSVAELKRTVGEAVRRAIGAAPTDVAAVCCNDAGNWILYVGLPGQSSRVVNRGVAPNGIARLPEDAIALSEKEEAAWQDAVSRGRVGEDDSLGYALAEDPDLRSRQIVIREYVLRSEDLLYRVIETSSDPRHRAIAASMLGYARQSRRQIRALVQASRDPDSEVRNNAVRVLGVLASAIAELARIIPVDAFVNQLSSGRWTDRNKAAALLERISRSREPGLLERLRTDALPALIETARWRWPGHSSSSRLLLGRVAGIDERRLKVMTATGEVEPIVDAVEVQK